MAASMHLHQLSGPSSSSFAQRTRRSWSTLNSHARPDARPRSHVAAWGDSGSVGSLYKLPLFISSSALMPTGQGRLSIFEQRYLEMFDALRSQAQQTGMQQAARFGHLISPSAAPPALLADASINGYPKVGTVAMVKSIAEEPGSNGSKWLVEYEGARRFQILAVVHTEPYVMAYVMEIADTPDQDSGSAWDGNRQQLNAVEREVYQALLEVVRLSNQLAPGADVGAHLPPAVAKYRPPSTPVPARKTLSESLIDAGYTSAGHSIAMWQSQGSVYGKNIGTKNVVHDPYQLAADNLLGSALRQELFSFAAAACVELGNAEKLALLNSRDTGARLAWVRQAVAPYLAELRARAAVSQVLGRGPVS